MSESHEPRPGWRHRVCAHHPCNTVAHAPDHASLRAEHRVSTPPSTRRPDATWPGHRHPAGRSWHGRLLASGSARAQPRRTHALGSTVGIAYSRGAAPWLETVVTCISNNSLSWRFSTTTSWHIDAFSRRRPPHQLHMLTNSDFVVSAVSAIVNIQEVL
jgi:hypothetical protein